MAFHKIHGKRCAEGQCSALLLYFAVDGTASGNWKLASIDEGSCGDDGRDRRVWGSEGA